MRDFLFIIPREQNGWACIKMTNKNTCFYFLHSPNVVLDFFWLPEFSISVDSWFINIVMIIILSLGFNLKEVVSVCLFLCSVMLSHDVQFRGIKVDTFL